MLWSQNFYLRRRVQGMGLSFQGAGFGGQHLGVTPKIGVPYFGDSYNKILLTILGSPIFGNSHLGCRASGLRFRV